MPTTAITSPPRFLRLAPQIGFEPLDTMYYDQPLEDARISISRAKGTVTYPAQFLLVFASNPCPCGYLGDPKKACKCLPGQISKYKKRVSGPILDRIDLHIDVPSVETQKLVGKSKAKRRR